MREKSVVLAMLLFVASTGIIVSPASAGFLAPHVRYTVVGTNPNYPTERLTFEFEVVEVRAERGERVFIVHGDLQFLDSQVPGGRVTRHTIMEFWVSVETGRVLYYWHTRTTYYLWSGAIKDHYTFTINLRYNGNELTAECAAVVLWKNGAELPDPIHEDATYTATPFRLSLQDILEFCPVRLPSRYNIGQTFTLFRPYFNWKLFKWQPITWEATVTEIAKVTVAAGTFTTYHLVVHDSAGALVGHVYETVGTHMHVMTQDFRSGEPVPWTYELTSYSHGARA